MHVFPKPPEAKQVPSVRTFHGDTFTDPYEWMRDKDSADLKSYVAAENAYTSARTAGLANLRKTLFDEFRSHVQETDMSVPTRLDGYWYYARTQEGKQYGVQCRMPIRGEDDWTPPEINANDAPGVIPGEQVILDANTEAEGHDFFQIGGMDISKDGTWLLFGVDTSGDEQYDFRIRNLDTGEQLPDELDGLAAACFTPDGRYVFATLLDDAQRPYAIRRHKVGEPVERDVIVYEEHDEKFWVGIGLSFDERNLVIGTGSKTTTEVLMLPTATPEGEFQAFIPRQEGVEYDVSFAVFEHAGEHGEDLPVAIVYHNLANPNFEIDVIDMSAARPPYRIGDGVRIVQGSPYGSEDGEKVIAGASAMPVGTPYDDATNPQILRGVRGLAVEGIAMHEHFVALSYRANGLPKLAVMSKQQAAQDFLARRENVDRLMVVRERGRHTQISVIEDNVLVEHYVSDIQEVATVGNIYLGRVQNVLPSMEAAFVDIGQARNGVLYAGEVNWDATRLEGQPRRIELAFKSGDPVLVQVTKDPIGHKGARLTSQVTLAGRFLVLVPSGGMTGVSRKLSDRERNRLKSIVSKIAPKDMGVIIRTAAEGASEEAIAKDLEGLTNQWAEIQRKREEFLHGKRPKLLQGEPDVAIRVVRDIFNDDFNKMIVEGDGVYHRIEEYLDHMAPDLHNKLERWDPEEHGGKDVFDRWQIDSQLRKGMERQVYLPSGGSIVIDRTEAMTTIDVNTGRFIGKGKSLEETVTRCNLEASEEIARQLRLRDIGGMVMIDYVDMVMPANRDLVLRRLVECLARDRTKHQVAEVTSLGLVQMTRKRIGQGLVEAFSEECPECKGRGFIVHDEPTISAEFDDPYAMKGGDPFVRTNKHGHGTPEVHAPKGSSAAVKAKLAQIAAAAVAANVAAEAEESVEAPAADTTEETAKVDVAVESTVESAAESAGNAGDTERVEQVEGEVIDDAEQSADDAAAVTVEDAAEES